MSRIVATTVAVVAVTSLLAQSYAFEATQTLLADRFGLRARQETRVLDIYALTMAKSGGQPGRALKPSRPMPD